MTDKPFDPTKPVRTRSGLEVKLFLECVGDKDHPLVGAVKDRDGFWKSLNWAANGRALGLNATPSYYDLVNVPERRSGWINIYESAPFGSGAVHETKDAADHFRHPARQRIACIYVEFEEGEGLNND